MSKFSRGDRSRSFVDFLATSAWLACDPLYCLRKLASVHCDSLAATGCPSSQIAIAKPTAVPLWKVIVGPRADELYRTRKGPVFLLRGLAIGCARARAASPRVHNSVIGRRDAPAFSRCPRGCLRGEESRFTLWVLSHPSALRPAAQSRERSNGLDHTDPRRNLHRPRDQRLPAGRVLIPTLSRLVLDGTPHRHRARLGGGWGLSAMELPVPGVPPGMER